MNDIAHRFGLHASLGGTGSRVPDTIGAPRHGLVNRARVRLNRDASAPQQTVVNGWGTNHLLVYMAEQRERAWQSSQLVTRK